MNTRFHAGARAGTVEQLQRYISKRRCDGCRRWQSRRGEAKANGRQPSGALLYKLSDACRSGAMGWASRAELNESIDSSGRTRAHAATRRSPERLSR